MKSGPVNAMIAFQRLSNKVFNSKSFPINYSQNIPSWWTHGPQPASYVSNLTLDMRRMCERERERERERVHPVLHLRLLFIGRGLGTFERRRGAESPEAVDFVTSHVHVCMGIRCRSCALRITAPPFVCDSLLRVKNSYQSFLHASPRSQGFSSVMGDEWGPTQNH